VISLKYRQRRFLSPTTPAPTEIHPLSLHDALPISGAGRLRAVPGRDRFGQRRHRVDERPGRNRVLESARESRFRPGRSSTRWRRSEEHTSELQSLAYLVCRLLLEKKKKNTNTEDAL